MPEARTTRRERGLLQDFANQLAQMAVGQEAMFVGSALEHEPDVGVIDIDAVARTASVNGHPVKLALADYLNDWVIAELDRKNLARSWLTTAIISIQYLMAPGNEDSTDWSDFRAVAYVTSTAGETSGSFANSQALVRDSASDKGEGSAPQHNKWNWFLLAVAAAGIVGGFVLSILPVGPSRTTAFWFVIPFPLLAIVGAVGWAFTEIRHQEQLSPRKSPAQRVLGYFVMLVVVVGIAIGGTLIPTRLAPLVWTLFIPMWLIGGWLVRTKSRARRRK